MPHGKWHIHSTYGDTHRMMTLSRGIEPLWINDHDAESIGIDDNDWVEVHNDHGVVVTRAVVSARIPRGVCIQYHSPERTLSVPKSPLRNNRRAGGHNSLTRTRLKPNLMVGGYGQFTFHFNYWGPTGANRDTHVLVRKLPAIYRLTSLCTFEDRFVIPPMHREEALQMLDDPMEHKQAAGFGFIAAPKRGV